MRHPGRHDWRAPMNTFIVDLKQRPGELAKLAESIAAKGIDITSFSGVTCGDSGSVALVTNDEAGTRRALPGAGFHSPELLPVTAPLPNVPGSLPAFPRHLP